MDSASDALAKLQQSDPQRFRKLCSDAKVLMQSPPFLRLKRTLDGLIDRHGLAFVASTSTGQIDPLLAALREGSKIYPKMIEGLAELGHGMERDGGSGVEKDAEPYHHE